LATIIRSFKSAATKRINTLRDNPGAPVWQRNYYERVIRDDRELHGIRQYIGDNPLRWEEDENHPARQTPIL
jgi:REP element-mobilizing transposase RayT